MVDDQGARRATYRPMIPGSRRLGCTVTLEGVWPSFGIHSFQGYDDGEDVVGCWH